MSTPHDAHEPTDATTVLATRLREARQFLGFSQEEVGEYLGIARSAVSNIENGQRQITAIELSRLAKLYQRPVGAFTGDFPQHADDADVNLLARQASELSESDRKELVRFAEFLLARKVDKGN